MTLEEHLEKALREMGVDPDEEPTGDPSEFLEPVWDEEIDDDDDNEE